MSEVKPIPGFPGYTITRGGTVRGPKGNKLSPRKDHDGYNKTLINIEKRCIKFN